MFFWKYLFRCIQNCLGWKNVIECPKENCIALYLHTSYWEAFLVYLYSCEANIIILLKPQLFNWASTPILNYLGYYPAPKLEERGTGSVQKISDLLRHLSSKNSKPTIFLISPKGTIQNKPWRSGYLHIAKNLNWPIKVMLVDYTKRFIEFQDINYPQNNDHQCNNNNDMHEKYQFALSKACPKTPENAEMKLNCCIDHFELLTVVDLLVISNWAMLFPIYKAFQLQHYFISGLASLVFLASSYYHFWKEECGSFLDKTLTKCLLFISFIFYWKYINMKVISWTIISFWFYYAGTPRIPGYSRNAYVVYHTLFHCVISFTAMLLIN